jgi:hypothetical protein
MGLMERRRVFVEGVMCGMERTVFQTVKISRIQMALIRKTDLNVCAPQDMYGIVLLGSVFGIVRCIALLLVIIRTIRVLAFV